MKKAIAAVSLLLALAGCSSSSSSSASSSLFKAGTYTGTGKGHNGDVTVEVVFTDSEIKSVTIKSQTETAGISDGAISDIPDEIVKVQSTKVDTVSGATVTSNAIIDAVNDCITQAGADPDSLGK